MSEAKGLVLNILNRSYTVECEEHQREDLTEAARHLSRQLSLLGGRGAGDRAFLSLALSTAYDHMRARDVRKSCHDKVRRLSRRIDTYLEAANP